MRIGHGYDVHRLVPDRPLILGGVLTTDKTLEILRKVCVEGVPPEPDKIKELEHFKSIE